MIKGGGKLLPRAAVSLLGRHRREYAAGANDERYQRRRACGQLRGRAGVHDLSARISAVWRRLALRSRGVSYAEEGVAR